jgi:hypothetical protein
MLALKYPAQMVAPFRIQSGMPAAARQKSRGDTISA